MSRVLLSPHPDDAVWSCGGMLGRWAAEPGGLTVVNVFDGPGMEARRAEDARALARWPLSVRGLGFTEAARRHGCDGRPLYPTPLARRRPRHRGEDRLVAEVAAALVPYLRDASEVLVPLARRTHVDHEIVREAAAYALDGSVSVGAVPAGASGVRVTWHEEFPYAPPRRVPAGLAAEEHPADLGEWLAAALEYRSEVTAMFGDAERFARALRRHARSGATDGNGGTGGTAVWRAWIPEKSPTRTARAGAGTVDRAGDGA
ncbi:PIG-L family deacetylase [Actinomadura viridis]|uniref:PIG-L family deacetylase n=1 Tax=Actinomadura viridis TaxID=58110 RepID=UPI00367AC0D2